MARKSANSDRYIISAAEVGSFVVCQEAWRLREVKKVKSTKGPSVFEGGKLHQDWAQEFDEASYLSQAVRIILLLVLLAVFFHLVFPSN